MQPITSRKPAVSHAVFSVTQQTVMKTWVPLAFSFRAAACEMIQFMFRAGLSFKLTQL